MKKLLIALLALCMVLSVVFVACEDPVTPPEETTPEVTTPEVTTPEATTPEETTPEATTPEETTPEETTPEETTPEETTPEETTPPADPVTTHLSFDELSMITDGNAVGFFTPGQSASWDKIANVEDYNVDTIKVWGWVGFFAEEIGQFGYQIGDAEPVFGEFTFDTEDAVIAAAAGTGAKSASRFQILIPVEYVGGEGITVKALARDAAGTVETLVEFTLNKPANPNAPVAFIPAADMASTLPGNSCIESVSTAADGSYISVTVNGSDPWYLLPMVKPEMGYNAKYVVIKYRTTATNANTAEIFVGSTGGPHGGDDNIGYDLVADGKWQLAILDLSQAPAVVDGAIGYLRWDAARDALNAPIDLAYIGLFNSAEAAVAYDANFKGVLIDTLTIDMNKEENAAFYMSDFAAAGISVPVSLLGYAQSVYVGNLNVAEFSKVYITYSCDGGDGTKAAFESASSLAIGLKNQNTSYGQETTDNFEGDLAHTDMVFSAAGWSGEGFRVAEVDLSAVDYNGDVWVAVHNPAGTQICISGIVFVYDPDYVAPIVKPEFGSEELPLTVTETLNAVAGLEEGAATENQYYTTGVVTEIGQTGSYYKNVYFTDGEQTMLIYTLNPMEGMPELKVGDTITVCGYVKNYNGTIEFASKYVDDAQVYVYIVAHEAAPVEEPAVFEGKWHTSVDSFMYCVEDDFSDVVTFSGAATNNTSGTTIANASGSLASVTAKYVYFAGGWIAVDGYSLENWACDIIAADGTVLKTVELGLKEAEEGVLTHVANNMGYAGVPNRLGNESEIIALGEYAGQTVKVVYRVDAVDTDYTINLIELEVIVP